MLKVLPGRLISCFVNILLISAAPSFSQENSDFDFYRDPTTQSPVPPGQIACCIKNPGSSCCGGGQNILSMAVPSFESAEPVAVIEDDYGLAGQCSAPMPGLSLIDRAAILTYANSPQGQACSLDALATSASISARSISEELLENYFKNCLGIGIYSEKEDHELSLSPLSSVWHQVGYLQRRNKGAPHCMATRIGSKILTSRHCIGNHIYNGNYILDKDLSNYDFYHLSDQSRGYKLDHDDKNFDIMWNLSDLKNDWIIFRLLNYDPESNLPDKISLGSISDAVNQDSKIVIPSIFRSLLSLSPETFDSWEESIVPDLSPTCRITYYNENFLYHGCQTVGGVSGAPILAPDGEIGLKIVGLHSGGTNKSLVARDQCITEIQALVPNWGIPTNDSMREALE